MKTVKIACGIKKIEDGDKQILLFRLREILHEHRNTLITRMITGLSAYIDYRFHYKAETRELGLIEEKLKDLKSTTINLDRYPAIIQSVLERERVYVSAEPFYKEIDELISDELNHRMKLV